MCRYFFVTEWRLKAPIEMVWEAIQRSARWPEWWPYVKEVVELAPGDERGLHAVQRLSWRTRLPYTLAFESTTIQVKRPTLLEASVKGELEGTGRWTLSYDNGITTVHYEWCVDTRKAWMNLFAPLARPVFKWNHDAVMRAGAQGLARRLNAPLLTC